MTNTAHSLIPWLESAIAESTSYLKEGGLGEVYGLALASANAGKPKVQMETEMALALCRMIMEAPPPIDWSDRATGQQGQASTA